MTAVWHFKLIIVSFQCVQRFSFTFENGLQRSSLWVTPIPVFWDGPETAWLAHTQVWHQVSHQMLVAVWREKKKRPKSGHMCVSRTVLYRVGLHSSFHCHWDLPTSCCFFCSCPSTELTWMNSGRCEHTVRLRTAPIWGEILPPGLSTALTSLQGTSWAIGQVWSSCFISAIVAAKSWLDFLAVCLTCLILHIHCYVLLMIFLHILPAFFVLLFLSLCPPWHFQAYHLSGIWPQERRHASVTLGHISHWVIVSVCLFATVSGFPPILLWHLGVNASNIR